MFDLHQYPYFAYDTETTGLQYPVDHVFGFSISLPDGQSIYYDIRETPKAKDWLNDQVRHYNGTIIAANASFDYRMSHSTGIFLPLERMDDVIIRACCIDEHLVAYDLDHLGKKYIGMEKDNSLYEKLASIFGGLATRNVQMKNISRAPSAIVAPYAERDTDITLAVWEWQQKEIAKQGIEEIVKFEIDKMPTFIRAEMRGIRIDENYAEEAADKITPFIDETQSKIEAFAGGEINLNSPKQVKEMFEPVKRDGKWFANDGSLLATTGSGGPSFAAEVLREMKHPAAALILEIRSLIKTRDTFLRGHVLGHNHGGYVYPTINQSKGEDGGTGTGRLSIQNPAMQQIPSRNKKIAAIVKPCFLPPEGMVWCDGDMNSFEVRVFAHLINNPEIVQAYHDNPLLDLHQFVADLTKLVRNAEYSGQPNAKQLNLSMIFNSGNGAIADKMGMPWEWNSFLPRGKEDIEENYITYKKAGVEAEKVIAAYHRRIPGVKDLADGCKATAERRGYIRTFIGRRLRFPRGYKSYKASGLLIQATAADINKENWSIIEEELGNDGHLMLNTHDSYSMALPENWEPYYNRVKASIERSTLRVPLILDFSGVGRNWWSALNNKGL